MCVSSQHTGHQSHSKQRDRSIEAVDMKDKPLHASLWCAIWHTQVTSIVQAATLRLICMHACVCFMHACKQTAKTHTHTHQADTDEAAALLRLRPERTLLGCWALLHAALRLQRLPAITSSGLGAAVLPVELLLVVGGKGCGVVCCLRCG